MNHWLYITRHWETTANIKKEIVWIKDVELTEKWFSEAHIIWNNIPTNIDLIITSPQIRWTVTSDILRKYNNAPIIEHPLLHPQNFWVIEWLTLNEAKEKWLWNNLYTNETDKYTHRAENWESAQEMEKRTIPQIYNLVELTKSQSINIILLTHNSISRCLFGNIDNLHPKEWVEHNIPNTEITKTDWINKVSIQNKSNSENWVEELLNWLLLNRNLTNKPELHWFLSEFSKISLHEELKVLNYLQKKFPNLSDIILNKLINIVSNTIILNWIMSEFKEYSNIEWVFTLLQFWSSIYWRNYSVKDDTDLDIELVIEEDNFDISKISTNILSWYKWNIESDYYDFVKSWADYFSFKTYYKDRLIDVRITKKECFDKICSSSLEAEDKYIMKEFRKQFREDGIVPWRRWFNWLDYTWVNDIDYSEHCQIIHYPLFDYISWDFVAWNNIDKYCSFTDTYKNSIDVKKQLFNLRLKFLKIFKQEKEKWNVPYHLSISDIFIRKDRLPKFMLDDLEARYKYYKILFNL